MLKTSKIIQSRLLRNVLLIAKENWFHFFILFRHARQQKSKNVALTRRPEMCQDIASGATAMEDRGDLTHKHKSSVRFLLAIHFQVAVAQVVKN